MNIKVCHMTSTHQQHIPRLIKESNSIIKFGGKSFVVAQGKSFDYNGIDIIGVEENNKGRFSRMTETSKKIYQKALELNADIYHIHDPELLIHALKLKRKGKIVIFDSHEFYGEQIKTKKYLPKILRSIIASVYMAYETYICKKIDAVIGVCTIEGKDYFLNRTKKTVLISNSSIFDEFKPSYQIDFSSRKKVIHVGVLSYERGITHLIKGVAKTGCKLLLAGNFSPLKYKEELDKLNEYKCVEYRGFLEKKEVIRVLDSALVGVATLLNSGQYHRIDTMATKVYEYMAMGLPVIVSDYPFARKLIEEEKCGICVDPENTEEIAQAINYLLDNPDIAKKMGENGRRAVLEKYNWGVEEKKLLKLYEELLYKKNEFVC